MDLGCRAAMRTAGLLLLSRAWVPTGSGLGLAYGVDWRGESLVIAAHAEPVGRARDLLAEGWSQFAPIDELARAVVIARGRAADEMARRWPTPESRTEPEA